MVVAPQRKRAHKRFSADITKVAKKNKRPFRTMTDLVNTNARFPQLIPVLIDRLKNVETSSGLTDPTKLHGFRSGVYRSLTTIDAIGMEPVPPLLFSGFYSEPPASPDVVATIGDALNYLAMPSDYDHMREIAGDRTLSFGRAGVIEWLVKMDPDDEVRLQARRTLAKIDRSNPK